MNYEKRREAWDSLATKTEEFIKKTDIQSFETEEAICFFGYLDAALKMLESYSEQMGVFEPEHEDKTALRALRHTLQTLNDLNGRMNISETEVNGKEDMLEFLDIMSKITELISQGITLQRDILTGQM